MFCGRGSLRLSIGYRSQHCYYKEITTVYKVHFHCIFSNSISVLGFPTYRTFDKDEKKSAEMSFPNDNNVALKLFNLAAISHFNTLLCLEYSW